MVEFDFLQFDVRIMSKFGGVSVKKYFGHSEAIVFK